MVDRCQPGRGSFNLGCPKANRPEVVLSKPSPARWSWAIQGHGRAGDVSEPTVDHGRQCARARARVSPGAPGTTGLVGIIHNRPLAVQVPQAELLLRTTRWWLGPVSPRRLHREHPLARPANAWTSAQAGARKGKCPGRAIGPGFRRSGHMRCGHGRNAKVFKALAKCAPIPRHG